MIRSLLASGFFTVALSAHAINYSDLWWNPNESGWGINLAQQGNMIFATWFLYGADSKPTWLVMSAGVQVTNPGSALPRFEGDLYQTTGPEYSAATFNPAQVGVVRVGQATITFETPHSGQLIYSVGGRTITKQIQRQSFGAPPLQGNYALALFSAARGSCFSISNNTGSETGMFRRVFALPSNGNYLTIRDKPGGSYWITEKSIVGASCTAVAETVTSSGRFVDLAGTYACDDGRVGRFSWSNVEVTVDRLVIFQPQQLALRLFGNFSAVDTTGEKCAVTGDFAAVGITCNSGPTGCSPDWPL